MRMSEEEAKYLERPHHALRRRWSGELESKHVINAQRLELQEHRGQVRSLHFRDGVDSHSAIGRL
jgi:hypothetical protein